MNAKISVFVICVEAIMYLLQWNLYKADTVGVWKKCLLYGDVRFIEIPYKNEYLASWCFESDRFVTAIL